MLYTSLAGAFLTLVLTACSLLLAPADASAQPMLTSRFLSYLPSSILGSELSENASTAGTGMEFGFTLTSPKSSILIGASLILEDYTISSSEVGVNEFSLNTVGFTTDIRYRFNRGFIQPYLSAQVGVNSLSVEALIEGETETLADAGILIIPSGGFMFNVLDLVMIDLNIRSHRSFSGNIMLSNGLETRGFNGVGVGLGASLMF